MLTLGLFQLSVWLGRTLKLITRTVAGTRCTTDRYGVDSWAVVSGCSDLIGRASAKYLAKQGFNLVLIGSTHAEVNASEAYVKDATRAIGKTVKTKKIVHDYTKNFTAQAYEKLFNEHLKGLDISVLHNNASCDATGQFCELDPDRIHDALTTNMYSATMLGRLMMDGFIERYEKNSRLHSLIVNTSAQSALVAVP